MASLHPASVIFANVFFFQNYQLISKSVAEEWALMETDLTRERGLWGPASSSQLDKWALDMVEGNSVHKIISPCGIQVLFNRYVLRIHICYLPARRSVW